MKLIFIPYPAEALAGPVFFVKPDTALLRNNQPFFYPGYTKDVRATLALVVRISRLGRSIGRPFANRYYDAVSVGMDLTAHDLLQQAAANNLPAACARAFDYSAPVGAPFLPVTKNIQEYRLQLFHNGREVTSRRPLLPYPPEEIIAHVSQFLTLKIGDYLYLHTPLATAPLQIGDTLAALLDGREALRVEVK